MAIKWNCQKSAFVKATFVSGTFDGKSLSLELPLPGSVDARSGLQAELFSD